ncbi:MAG: hypothetical protein AB8G99_12055, partial [Planctomycetaceae bacterium]
MPRDYDDEYDEVDDDVEELDEIEEVVEVDDDDNARPGRAERGERRGGRDRGERRDRSGGGPLSNLFRMIGGEPQRPGEQDVVRSPIILWLTGGSIVVFLLAMVLYFMIVKKSAEKMYEFAKTEMDGGKYAQSIELYDKFILEYPDHELTAEAYIDKGKCRILKEISGADPNVGPGLTALEEFVKARRDQPNFADHKPDIRSWAKKITLEAAK